MDEFNTTQFNAGGFGGGAGFPTLPERCIVIPFPVDSLIAASSLVVVPFPTDSFATASTLIVRPFTVDAFLAPNVVVPFNG